MQTHSHTRLWSLQHNIVQDWEDAQNVAEVKLSAEGLLNMCNILHSIPNTAKCMYIKDYTESKTFL